MSSHMPDEKTDENGAQAERARLGPSLLLCGKTFRGKDHLFTDYLISILFRWSNLK